MTALIQLKDMIIQTLNSHLDFGHTQCTEPDQFGRVDFVRPGFNRETHIPMDSGFVDKLGFEQPNFCNPPHPIP